MLKTLLAGVRVLEKYGGHYPDAKTQCCLTRLFARCIENNDTVIDISLLTCGTIPEEWNKAAIKARTEYIKGGISSKNIRSKSVKSILAPLPEKDILLCRWMLGKCIFEGLAALDGQVAANAKSWKCFRELLFVGAQASRSNALDKETWLTKTSNAVDKLIDTPAEQRDGSTRTMPTVHAIGSPSYPGMVEDVERVDGANKCAIMYCFKIEKNEILI